jgi:hypothetical protein
VCVCVCVCVCVRLHVLLWPSICPFSILSFSYHFCFLSPFFRALLAAWLRLEIFCNCIYKWQDFNKWLFIQRDDSLLEMPHSNRPKLTFQLRSERIQPHIIQYLPKVLSSLSPLIGLSSFVLTACVWVSTPWEKGNYLLWISLHTNWILGML